MKKTLFLAVAATIILLTSCAKTLTMQELPQPVQTEFIKRYQSAKETKWKYHKKKNTYEADFKLNNNEFEVVFDAGGKVLSVEQD